MNQIGLKLFSTNRQYIENAVKLFDKNIYQYIELYTVPGSYGDYKDDWKNLNIPYVIHAPHSAHGLNLAKSEKEKKNMELADDAKRYADCLKADIIIYHPGNDGRIEEAASQLRKINDNRIVVENKPYFSLDTDIICVGHSPEEIKYIIDCCNTGFCLDIGHCVFSANAKKTNPIEYLKRFLEYNPSIFHLTDGNYSNLTDEHEHLGDGSFELNKIFSILPDKIRLTLETKKDFDDSLGDFEKDVEYLNRIINDIS